MTKLHRAEGWIRKYGESESGSLELSCGECLAIARELDRLRAEVSALKGEASRTVYTWWHEPEGSVEQMLLGFWERDVNAARGSRPDDTCDRPFAIRLSATEVKP